MRTNVIFWLLMTCFTIAQAQQRNYWTLHTGPADRVVKAKAVNRTTFPTSFQLFDLNLQTLQPDLMAAVNTLAKAQSVKTVISLPNANGGLEEFEVFECSNFEPDLQANFPDIRAFSGRGISDKAATLKLSLSPMGIQTMVFRANTETEFIEPYSQDNRVYAVFRRKRVGRQLPWQCSTEEKNLIAGINNQVVSIATLPPISGEFRTLRLAQSCNGEYANYFNATSPSDSSKVLAAFNNTLTRCNGIYERDLALHLNLIARTTAVIYYDPKSDPYSPNLSTWNSQLQKTLTNVIGEANYDIGHLFGASGGGGNAGCIGCVCVDGSKGSGITSPADGIPTGDYFDIDYVIHEVGHQLGANHTFSMSNEGTGQNKEVGSGITIMGYAGITSQDVARHSIDIFHETSIFQILSNLINKQCAKIINISNKNHPPTVNSIGPFTIPISTPFTLTDTATDLDGDSLTYCWEQDDNASSSQTGSSSVAAPDKNPGPNWISFSPTNSLMRIFPQLPTILAGSTVTGPLSGGDAGANTEALSSVRRDLNFKLTVRDNHRTSMVSGDTSVGQIGFVDVKVTVSDLAGPFAVSSHNMPASWTIGTSQNVTWTVNKTNLDPINCSAVRILLSTDSGRTFPIVLAESTPNDSIQSVSIPITVQPTNNARIKIEAIGNIFFDINNANISLVNQTSCAAPSGLSSSGLDTTTATVSWRPVSGASISYWVNYKLSSSADWNSTLPVTNDTFVVLTSLTKSSLYDWRVKTICGVGDSSTFSAAQFTTLTPSCRSAYDTSTNNTTSGAKTIPLNTDIKGLISPSGDIDHYKFSLSSADTLRLTLTTLPANYNLKLLNSVGTQLALSQNNGTANELITYPVSITGVYYAQVFGKGNASNASSCYTLKAAIQSTVKIAQKTKNNLIGTNESIYSLASGFIKIFPNPVNSLLQLYGRGWTTPVEVEVYQMNGQKAISQRLQPGWMTIDVSRLVSGLYLLRIKNPSGEVLEHKFLKQ